ncbi:exonuclease domain-containing protein [Arenibacter latericius]|uniref:exonuclease domain-containing protein n=1 Tax=Arenibacter latericius TaxID=86104 RepID=UPI0003FFC503|nr:exonuclease domain-containing protein [Arenibacter latericius]MDX1363577.1 exonuclease domain-containing protein [Arenibacter latericius]
MYVVLDIETTGGKYNEEGITEIAIHKFDGHKVVDRFISLINPEKEIQPFVVNLTGINNKMLRTAPKFYEVAKRIVEITEDAVIVAHNAQFDYRILRTEFRRLGYNFERKTLCTVELSKQLLPDAPSYSLGKLVRSLGIPVSDRHRANGDALATLQLFKLLLSKDLDKTILKNVLRNETHGELSPKQLDIVESLPSELGVFYIHNKDGDIIMLSKSNNIKKRINQYFINNGPKARKIQKETKRVTYERTGNELAAMLKENSELIRNKPKYNSNYKRRLFSHGLYQSINEHGYLSLTAQKIDPKKNAIATFNSLIGAENFLHAIRDEFQLCNKVNGLSQAKKECSYYTESKCLGACCKKESVESYNNRVKECIKKYSIPTQDILILEKGRETGERCGILIKNGNFKGLGYFSLNHQINNAHILESVITPMDNNDNTKHIITSYLRKKRDIKILEL